MNRKTVLAVAVLSAVLLVSCKSSESQSIAERVVGEVTMDRVQYNGWHDFVSNENYVFAGWHFETKSAAKYNLSTGTVTEVCVKPGCDHMKAFEFNPDGCPVPKDIDPMFTIGNKLYYTYFTIMADKEELETLTDGGSVKSTTWYYFASYDITTGEYRELLKLGTTDLGGFSSFIYRNGRIYFNQYIPSVSDPKEAKDFDLCLCSMDTDGNDQKILCNYSDFKEIKTGMNPMLIAVEGSTVWLVSNETGQMFSINTDTDEIRFLVKGDDGFLGIYDGYGTFYLDGYIYFEQFASDVDDSIPEFSAQIAYRVNCESGKIEKLFDDYVRWIFVTDDAVYYEMSEAQPTEEQTEEAGGMHLHVIKKTDHEGNLIRTISFREDYTSLTGVWAARDKMFFIGSYRDEYKYGPEQGEMEEFIIVLNLKDGSFEEIGRESVPR